jgi:HlyD family secretion protein
MRGIIILVVLVGLTVGGVLLYREYGIPDGAGDSDEARFCTVLRGNLHVSIVETGTLQALKSTRIHSLLDREAKIVFIVDEGERVARGDVLVRFDATNLDREIDAEKQALQASQAEYEAARVDLEIQRTDGTNEIARAELTLDEAEKTLEKYEKGELPLKKKENQVNLEEAQANLQRAREKLARMPGLLKEGFVTPDRVEQEKIDVKKAEVAWESARSEKHLFEKYTQPLELEKKNAAIVQARAKLEAARKRVAARLRQKEADLSSMKATLDNRQAKLTDLQAQRKETSISAPTDGLVIYGERDRWGGGSEIKVGSQVWRHTTIINLPDLSRMQVNLKVHEMDVDRIRKDMEVDVAVEAAGTLSYPGRITYIAELASEGGWRSDPEVRQFNVEVTLNGKDLSLKPGTTAKVEIVLDHLKDVLYVPVAAIRGVGKRTFCYAEQSQALVPVTVEIGLSNDKFVEIRSGLSQGDRVLISTPSRALLAAEEKERNDAANVGQDSGQKEP